MTPTQPIQQYTQNSTKRLLQRISQISQLQNHTTFGILVSNPSTKFCQQQIRRVRQVLDGRNLKHFTFMMSNYICYLQIILTNVNQVTFPKYKSILLQLVITTPYIPSKISIDQLLYPMILKLHLDRVHINNINLT